MQQATDATDWMWKYGVWDIELDQHETQKQKNYIFYVLGVV